MRVGRDSEVAHVPLRSETYEILSSGPGCQSMMPGSDDQIHHALAPILLCDHAGNAFPEGYGTLGLPAEQVERHIAYDIGAAGVVRLLTDRLARHGFPATAILSRYSRLLIDLNRGPDDPTLIMRLSDGAIVPGNHPIDQSEWNRRLKLFYEPYHRAIEHVIEGALRRRQTPVVISIHSFTHAWKGVDRPWHAGILWDRDDRLPMRLLRALRADPHLVVGDNEPYSGRLEGDCLDRHATRRGLANALVEIRQDLISSTDGQQEWADRLGIILEQMLRDGTTMVDLQHSRSAYHIDRISA